MQLFRVFALWIGLALALAPASALAQPLIVIDPGHGGTDPGAVGCSLYESNVVLDVGTRLRTLLERGGVRVAMTRDTDVFISLSGRATFANSRSANGFFSIHSNSNGGTPASGIETFLSNGAGSTTLRLATLIQNEMVATWPLPNRGVKRADFAVLVQTSMSAALAEMAFTNNCAVDATYLSSATRRQEMAEAQARAIFAWLGISPSTDGTLRGVAFEDQGVGTDDMSVRLPGATLRVTPGDHSTTATGDEANWTFTLAPGSYTVEASAPGHRTATRTCEVTGGGTTWCSIGLLPNPPEPMPDAAVPEEPVDAAVPEEPVDAAVPEEPVDAATTRRDAGSTSSSDGSTITSEPLAGSCACSVPARGSAPSPWTLLFGLGVGLALVVRRRRAIGGAFGGSLLTLLALALTGGCASNGTATVEALTPLSGSSAEEPIAAAIERVEAIEGAPLRILGERELLLVTDDEAVVSSPIISPDARHLLVSSDSYGALHLVALDAPDVLTPICRASYCGYEPRFFGEGLIATRMPEQTASSIPSDAYTFTGQRSSERLGSGGALAWVRDEDTVLVRVNGATRTLRRGDDRFISAELSPDRRHVVVWGLATGVSLHRLSDGARVDLGANTGHPHFDPEGRVLVFDQSEDEGHVLTAGDVSLATLGERVVVHPALASERIETSPTISSITSGGRATIAAERDGAIVLVDVALDGLSD